MVSPYQYIQDKPQRARGIIGIEYEEFNKLCEQAKKWHEEQKEEAEKRKIRVNAKGGGRTQELAIPEQICLCLVYLRHLPTFEMLGMQFDVSKSTANNIFHSWLHLFRERMPASVLEDVEKGFKDAEEVETELQKDKLLLDSSEQPRERPGDYRTQKNTIQARRSNTHSRTR